MWHRCVCHAQLLPSLTNHNAVVSFGLEVPCSSTTPSFTFSFFYPALYFSLRKVLARTCHPATKYWGHSLNSKKFLWIYFVSTKKEGNKQYLATWHLLLCSNEMILLNTIENIQVIHPNFSELC